MSISISKDKLLDMYRKMLLIRYHELTVKELFASGRIPGFVHLYVGEEAVAVGVMSNLKEEDYITSTHRVREKSLINSKHDREPK
ncbi:hypothetical protein DJ531_10520, partial [Sulfolobus sp. A20-N-F6]